MFHVSVTVTKSNYFICINYSVFSSLVGCEIEAYVTRKQTDYDIKCEDKLKSEINFY